MKGQLSGASLASSSLSMPLLTASCQNLVGKYLTPGEQGGQYREEVFTFLPFFHNKNGQTKNRETREFLLLGWMGSERGRREGGGWRRRERRGSGERGGSAGDR
eukprot:GHVL01019549.1.p1 GENE.GHVL01019549.1~~GHVL01019549.1.p1  ORF type:complete len:104 (+),score=20.59 GHVL01019549.1:230-541(+)